jgi:predicted permease
MKEHLTFWHRFRLLGGTAPAKAEIDEELRFHLEQRTRENLAAGMAPDAAARAARKRFGNLQSIREQCRDARGASFGDGFWQDLRFGLRMLRKYPAFTGVAVLSLAIGIGVNTTIYSAMDAAVLRPLNIKNPDEIVRFERPFFTYAEYREIKAHARSLADLIAIGHHMSMLRGNEDTATITADYASPNYFTALGVKPALGRLFSEADQQPQNQQFQDTTVVLNYGTWQRRFGADPNIVGKTIPTLPLPATVIGVAAKGYDGMSPVPPELVFPSIRNAIFEAKARDYELVGRRAPGYTVEQVQAELETLVAHLGWDLPKPQPGEKAVEVVSQKKHQGAAVTTAWLVLPVVNLVLLVACANVSSLLLARYEERRRELALRAAVGGSRRRLMRQLLIEALLLALLGLAVAVLFTLWGVRLLPSVLPAAISGFAPPLHVNGRVLALATASACLATFVFALLPAWRATRVDLAPLLKGESAPASSRARWFTLRTVLVVAQLAVSVVFLTSAALLVRGFAKGMASDVGFNPRNLLILMLGSASSQGKGDHFDQLEQHVRALPGVRSASLVCPYVPFALSGGGATCKVLPPHATEAGQMPYSSVEPGYFDTLGIRLLQGRDFQAQDRGSAPQVAIVSESLAKKFWPGDNPLGKTLQAGLDELTARQIVGVVRDVDAYELGRPTPFLYLPFQQEPRGDIRLVVRTDGRAQGMAQTVRRALREVDKDLLVVESTTMEGTMRVALLPQWLGAWLGGLLGALAFLLSVTGLYGVISYAVSARTRDLGIRMALGARRSDVLWLVLRQGLMLALAGVALGLPVAIAIGFLMRSVLFGIGPADPAALAGSCALVIAVALLASFVPARRASRINIMNAIRYE